MQALTEIINAKFKGNKKMELTLSELKRLLQKEQQNTTLDLSDYIGEYVVVRANLAGTFIGKLEAIAGRDVVLSDAYHAWMWKTMGGITLLSVANNGINLEESRIDGPTKTVVVADFCELIVSCEMAYKTFGG